MTDDVLVRIRKRREEKGLSQENMAEMLGVNQSTYAKIETGVIRLSLPRLEGIAKALDCSINDLLSSHGTERLSMEMLSSYMLNEPPVKYGSPLFDELIETKNKYISELEEKVQLLRDKLKDCESRLNQTS